MRAVLTSNRTDSQIVSLPTSPSVIPCVISKYLLKYKETQFMSNFYESLCAILSRKKVTTTLYHSLTSRQGECFYRSITAWLGHYMAEHQRALEIYVKLLLYVHNAHAHLSTSLPRNSCTLSRHPPRPRILGNPTALPSDITTTTTPQTLRARLLHRVMNMPQDADE